MADALDAMTSDRPYRGKEMTLEEALEELRRNAGTQFDEHVVRAVEDALRCGDLSLLPRTTDQFAAVTGGAPIARAEMTPTLVRD